MNNPVRLPYLIFSGILLLAGCLAAALTFFLMIPDGFSAISPEAAAIVTRTAERTGSEAAADVWKKEIGSGKLTLSEYVRVAFTGTQYLLKGNDDSVFARDLSYAVYGTEDRYEPLVKDLADASRVYVAENVLRGLDAAYAPSVNSADRNGTRLLSASLDESVQDDEGYSFGVRKVSGSISISGDDARTDFYVDGNLRPGQLEISEDSDGTKSFSLAWDTRRESPGTHTVQVLLRTSDGRAQVLSGGDVIIPEFFTLVNDGVQKGSIPTGTGDVWYALDAKDRNAYINFVGLSGDIRVTLYDMYGNWIGTNDLPGTQTEVLRGKKQDIPQQDVSDPYVGAWQNIFYARVEKGAANTSADEITYMMVQSKEVAVNADGKYLAVISETGDVPTQVPSTPLTVDQAGMQVTCRDLNAEEIICAASDLTFLPINGRIASFSLSDGVSAEPLRYYPAFDPAVDSYAFVSETALSTVKAGIAAAEGYAASVRIESEAGDGTQAQALADGTIPVNPSANTVRFLVTDFDGNSHEYTLYLLSGPDSAGYSVSTLGLFPESFRSGIWLLHNLQPSYQFVPYQTGIAWSDLMAAEDYKSRSLANDSSHPGWIKEGSPVYDGKNWRAAGTEVVSYFLDPRNFLDPVHVFMFEKLSFDPSVHTIDGVKAMVKGTFLESDNPDYAEILLEAGREAGISPYFLASRILQEMGRQGQSMLSSGTLPGYEGIYNFFNIGSTPNPDVKNGALINGAKFAMWGKDADQKTVTDEEKALLLPWTSPELAIRGGALWIASSYIAVSQDTLYFQKFDVINNEDGLFVHQYAQNISMAYSEGARYHSAYLSQDMLASPFTFIIPVYAGMPDDYGFLPAAD